MTTHKATNHIIPPLVVLGIVGCVWYASSSQPKPNVALPTPQPVAAAESNPGTSNTASTTTADQAPIADVAPIVHKLGHEVSFSVNTTQFKQVQKVEFYIETKLVGAVFSQPYTMSVDENNLSAGTHTVTAKVYTNTATAQTTPALFTATPTKPVVTPIKDTTADDDTPPPANTTPASTTVATPTGLTASANADGTSASLKWDTTPSATSYQIWRDGAIATTVTITSYTDTGLKPGQTYDYSIVALSGSQTSSPSSQVAVTMVTLPTPPPPEDGTPPPTQNDPSGSGGSTPGSGDGQQTGTGTVPTDPNQLD